MRKAEPDALIEMRRHEPVPVSLDPVIEALVQDIIGQVADRWTMLILEALEAGGTLRYTQLRKAVPGISQKMLTQTVRQMERDGLVRRTVHPGNSAPRRLRAHTAGPQPGRSVLRRLGVGRDPPCGNHARPGGVCAAFYVKRQGQCRHSDTSSSDNGSVRVQMSALTPKWGGGGVRLGRFKRYNVRFIVNSGRTPSCKINIVTPT